MVKACVDDSFGVCLICMINEDYQKAVSATVLEVFERFFMVMRDDPEISDDAITRLEILLRKGRILKPDEINTLMFESPVEDST